MTVPAVIDVCLPHAVALPHVAALQHADRTRPARPAAIPARPARLKQIRTTRLLVSEAPLELKNRSGTRRPRHDHERTIKPRRNEPDTHDPGITHGFGRRPA